MSRFLSPMGSHTTYCRLVPDTEPLGAGQGPAATHETAIPPSAGPAGVIGEVVDTLRGLHCQWRRYQEQPPKGASRWK